MTGCVRLAWEVDEGKAGCVRGQVGENIAECLDSKLTRPQLSFQTLQVT